MVHMGGFISPETFTRAQLTAERGDWTRRVSSYCMACGLYITKPEEYAMQRYEGASTVS
jgi:hypothetical protein